MEALREIIEVDSDRIEIEIPEMFRNRKIEIIVVPADETTGGKRVRTQLEERFKDVVFEETDPELDHAGDIDYIGKVGDKAFGIQIKPVTANANLASYSITARMEESFRNFEVDFGGKVFIIFSVDKDINNMDILEDIQKEIDRLKRYI